VSEASFQLLSQLTIYIVAYLYEYYTIKVASPPPTLVAGNLTITLLLWGTKNEYYDRKFSTAEH
jgi:hypothetical protein